MCRRISNNYLTHHDCNIYGINSVFIGWKYNTVSKKIISQFKYKYSYKLANLISDLLIKRLYETNFLKKVNPNTILIPIPIHSRHFIDRGFNQSSLIAENISKEFNIPVVDDALFRRGSSKSQARSSIIERKGLKDVFYLKRKLSNQNIIILDDVVTTSATINSAARVLNGNSIKAIALFRGKPRYHR
jgi:ComF family protein